MRRTLCAMIAAAATMAAFAAPALAETECTIKRDIRVRQKPSKKAHVVTILKKDAKVSTGEKCAGGWVKVSTADGKIAGYVGGWALADSSPAVSSAPAEGADKQTATAPAEPAAEKKEIPTNEQLAIQITDLRVRVLSMERSMKKVNREIHKIKSTLARNAKAENTQQAPQAAPAPKPGKQK